MVDEGRMRPARCRRRDATEERTPSPQDLALKIAEMSKALRQRPPGKPYG